MQEKIGLVIPCYNEAARLDFSIIRTELARREYLSILLVDDGSTDDTGNLIAEFCAIPEIAGRCHRILMGDNQGKGEAVRQGMNYFLEHTDCDIIGFWDADFATPLHALDDFEKILLDDKNRLIIIGSRVRLSGRVIQRNPLRHYISRAFITFASLTLGFVIYDTQCGAKLFRRGVLKQALAAPFESRWLFDIELFLRIQRAGHPQIFKHIYEVPLHSWEDKAGSKVNISDFIMAPLDFVKIYRTHRKNSPR